MHLQQCDETLIVTDWLIRIATCQTCIVDHTQRGLQSSGVYWTYSIHWLDSQLQRFQRAKPLTVYWHAQEAESWQYQSHFTTNTDTKIWMHTGNDINKDLGSQRSLLLLLGLPPNLWLIKYYIYLFIYWKSDKTGPYDRSGEEPKWMF